MKMEKWAYCGEQPRWKGYVGSGESHFPGPRGSDGPQTPPTPTPHSEIDLLVTAISGIKKVRWPVLRHLATNLPSSQEQLTHTILHPVAWPPQEDAAIQKPLDLGNVKRITRHCRVWGQRGDSITVFGFGVWTEPTSVSPSPNLNQMYVLHRIFW